MTSSKYLIVYKYPVFTSCPDACDTDGCRHYRPDAYKGMWITVRDPVRNNQYRLGNSPLYIAPVLDALPPIGMDVSGWDTSKVTNMTNLFQ